MGRLIENLAWGSVGAGLGYLLSRRRLEAEFQKRLDRQIENADDFYRRKYEKKLKEERKKDLGETKETIEILVNESPEEIVDILKKGVEEIEEVYKEQADKIIADAGLTYTVTDYQGFFTGEMAPYQFVKKTPPAPKSEDVPEVQHNEKNPGNLPVEISEEAYMENVSGFKQLSRTYYAGDDILATEENKIVPDGIRQHTLGPDVIEKLKMGLEGNAKVIYVRNKDLVPPMEYEIFREPDSYGEVVGPIGSVE